MVMEDFRIRDYNQHQLMKREPTFITGPGLVFLSLTKKGLRSSILKCNILLERAKTNLCIAHQYIFSSQLLISTTHHYFSSMFLITTAHQISHPCYSSLLLITIAHLYFSSLLLIILCCCNTGRCPGCDLQVEVMHQLYRQCLSDI